MKTIADFLPQVEKALGYGSRYTAQELAREVVEGRAQLWQEGEGMIITQIETTPRGLELYFWIAVGDLDDVLELEHKVCEWGRSIGCRPANFVGRRGWTKPLVAHGWTSDERVRLFHKEL